MFGTVGMTPTSRRIGLRRISMAADGVAIPLTLPIVAGRTPLRGTNGEKMVD